MKNTLEELRKKTCKSKVSCIVLEYGVNFVKDNKLKEITKNTVEEIFEAIESYYDLLEKK